jgi:hypothetical protein
MVMKAMTTAPNVGQLGSTVMLGFSLAVSDNIGLVSATPAIVYVLIQDYGYNNIPS